MCVDGQNHAPAALPQEKGLVCTNCIGGWVGHKTCLDGCGKSRPPPGFNPRTVQPVASYYTDWAVPILPCNQTRMQSIYLNFKSK